MNDKQKRLDDWVKDQQSESKLEKIYEDIQSGEYPVLNSLEAFYQCGKPNNSYELDFLYRRGALTYFDKEDGGVLQRISMYIGSGVYPPPELLILLNNLFTYYLTLRGEYSLEEVFFGPPTKGKGNLAKRLSVKHKYRDFEMQILFDKGKSSENELAKEFIEEPYYGIKAEDEWNFLRAYRKHKKSSD